MSKNTKKWCFLSVIILAVVCFFVHIFTVYGGNMSTLTPLRFDVTWYCPKCYKAYHIRPNLARICSNCNDTLWYYKDELPKTVLDSIDKQ